jgi:hypothetical protein
MAYAITTLEIPSSGIEIDVRVEYDYRPGCEAQTYGPAENCHPGEPAEVEITEVTGLLTGLDVMPLLISEKVMVRGYGTKRLVEQPLLASLTDEMMELGDPEEDRRSWRRAA